MRNIGPRRARRSAAGNGPPAPCFIVDADQTLPDLVIGEKTDTWGALVVINATTKTARGLKIVCSGDGLSKETTGLPEIPPVSQIRQVMKKSFEWSEQ